MSEVQENMEGAYDEVTTHTIASVIPPDPSVTPATESTDDAPLHARPC